MVAKLDFLVPCFQTRKGLLWWVASIFLSNRQKNCYHYFEMFALVFQVEPNETNNFTIMHKYIKRIPKMKKFLFIICNFPTNCLYLFVWNVFKWFHEKTKILKDMRNQLQTIWKSSDQVTLQFFCPPSLALNAIIVVI